MKRPSAFVARTCLTVLVLGALIASPLVPLLVVLAAAHTITYTTQQDSMIQTRIVGGYNRQHCAKFGRPSTCTSADLVASGCVVKDMCDVLGLNPASSACVATDGMNVESCVIYAATLAGQDALMIELLNQNYVSVYQQSIAQSEQDYKTAFDTATLSQQQAACTAIGLPANCDGP
jgi:hypothetical protein